METQHEISIYGTKPLPCSVTDLEASVFRLVEGLGDVTGSGVGERGWKLDLAFDSVHCFTEVIDAVRESLTNLGGDLQSVTVSVRGKRRRLVDLR
jgi:hypothetical protein